MTCELFAEITLRPVEQATRAERIAAYRHHEACEACRKLIESREKAELPPDACKLIDEIAFADAFTKDPEC